MIKMCILSESKNKLLLTYTFSHIQIFALPTLAPKWPLLSECSKRHYTGGPQKTGPFFKVCSSCIWWGRRMFYISNYSVLHYN